jgi:hypothetical protein
MEQGNKAAKEKKKQTRVAKKNEFGK